MRMDSFFKAAPSTTGAFAAPTGVKRRIEEEAAAAKQAKKDAQVSVHYVYNTRAIVEAGERRRAGEYIARAGPSAVVTA